MGIAAEIRSKGFEAKLWKEILQEHCSAEFPACLDLTENVIRPPYVSHTSPDVTAPGLKTIPAPQCICYIPQSCLAHLRAETHVLRCAVTLRWEKVVLRTKLSPVSTSEPLGWFERDIGHSFYVVTS